MALIVSALVCTFSIQLQASSRVVAQETVRPCRFLPLCGNNPIFQAGAINNDTVKSNVESHDIDILRHHIDSAFG